MKTNLFSILLFVLILGCFSNPTYSQTEEGSEYVNEHKYYVIEKHNGVIYIGEVLSQDAREVLIETKELGQVIIPKHEIREMKEIQPGELSSSFEYIPEEVFATRYFITTNGLPIQKGESYIQWNLFGPDFQFGIGDNFGVGLMTTWVGSPIIGTAKYSISLSEDINLGIGTLLGTGSWINPEIGIALPFAAITFGDRKKNINLSAGYGAIWGFGNKVDRALLSVAGMAKIIKNISFVFDTFILPPAINSPGIALVIPGLRWQTKRDRAFQFGFAGVINEFGGAPIPLPMIQWYRIL